MLIKKLWRHPAWSLLLRQRCLAFSLLECLVALLVISGSLLVFEGLTQLLAQEVRGQQVQTQVDWLVFADQLRHELDGTDFVAVKDNKLYVDKSGQALAFGLSKAKDFRKTHAGGRGYQPMLFGLKKCQISQDQQEIRVTLTFETGEERVWLYDFTPAG